MFQGQGNVGELLPPFSNLSTSQYFFPLTIPFSNQSHKPNILSTMVVQAIPKESWDALLRPDESPFLEHDWLCAMEKSNCATVDTGASDALTGEYSFACGVFEVQQAVFFCFAPPQLALFVNRVPNH